MYWRQQAAVGAVSGQSRRWARPVVETEGPQAEGSSRSGAGSCPQSITRQNKNSKNQKIKKNKPRAPPISILGEAFCLAKWLEALAGAVPNSRILRPAGLSSWIPVAPHLYTLGTSYPEKGLRRVGLEVVQRMCGVRQPARLALHGRARPTSSSRTLCTCLF